jgi:hypothetical protein
MKRKKRLNGLGLWKTAAVMATCCDFFTKTCFLSAALLDCSHKNGYTNDSMSTKLHPNSFGAHVMEQNLYNIYAIIRVKGEGVMLL